jgi:hypothetical protein
MKNAFDLDVHSQYVNRPYVSFLRRFVKDFRVSAAYGEENAS